MNPHWHHFWNCVRVNELQSAPLKWHFLSSTAMILRRNGHRRSLPSNNGSQIEPNVLQHMPTEMHTSCQNLATLIAIAVFHYFLKGTISLIVCVIGHQSLWLTKDKVRKTFMKVKNNGQPPRLLTSRLLKVLHYWVHQTLNRFSTPNYTEKPLTPVPNSLEGCSHTETKRF